MKTRFRARCVLTAVVTLLGSLSLTLDAAEPKRRSSPKPQSEVMRAIDRIGDLIFGPVRDWERRERVERDVFDDPFFYPSPPPLPDRRSRSTGIYPVDPALEEYFLYRRMHPYVDDRRISPPSSQRQTMTFPPPAYRERYLPYYQTLGREPPPIQRPSYQPLTPSAAGEAPRVSGRAAPPSEVPEVSSSPPSTLGSPSIQNQPSVQSSPSPQTGPAGHAPAMASRKPPAVQNLPTAKPVPGRPGLVYPPGSEDGKMVDVRGFVSGQKVADPQTGKIFLVP